MVNVLMEPEKTIHRSPFGLSLQGAIYSGLFFMLIFMVVNFTKISLSRFLTVGLHFSAIFTSVFLTQAIAKKLYHPLTYKLAWLSGWFSAVILGVLMMIFSKIVSMLMMPELNIPTNLLTTFLMGYNMLGLIFSAILAFIFKTR